MKISFMIKWENTLNSLLVIKIIMNNFKIYKREFYAWKTIINK